MLARATLIVLSDELSRFHLHRLSGRFSDPKPPCNLGPQGTLRRSTLTSCISEDFSKRCRWTLLQLSKQNSVELMEDWIRKDGDINVCDANGFTALHYAASRDHGDVRTLLRHRADFRRGIVPPVALASIVNDGSLVLDAQLDYGLDPNTIYGGDRSILFWAVSWGSLNCTRLLVKHHTDVNHLTLEGGSVLIKACSMVHAEFGKLLENRDTMLAIVRTLVASVGIKLDHRGPQQRTALHHAAIADSIEAVTCLIEAGANPSIRDFRGRIPADCVRVTSAVKEYLHSCQGPVSLVAMNRADDGDDNVFTPDVQTAACLLDPGRGATLSVKKVDISSTTVSHLQRKAFCASAGGEQLSHASASESDRPPSQLILGPRNVDQRIFFTLHQLPSPPAISVYQHAFQRTGKKPTSKKEIKAARKEEKTKMKDAAAARKSLVPVGDSSHALALPGSHQLVQCQHPNLSLDTSKLVSPFVAVSANKPVILQQPGKLIIPHAARPVGSGQTDPRSCSYDFTVQEASLRDDGRGLTEWGPVDDKDVHASENCVTVVMRSVSWFSAFFVTTVKKKFETVVRNWMLKEKEFCVVGSQYYEKVMIPRVAWFTNGYTPRAVCHELASRDTVERAVVWGSSHAVQVPLDEDMRVKISMDQDDWSVDPEEQKIQKTSFNCSLVVLSLGLKLTAPSSQPCEVAGLCIVHVAGDREPLKIPFSPPRTIRYDSHGSSSTDLEKAFNCLAFAEAESSSSQDPVTSVSDAAGASKPSAEFNHKPLGDESNKLAVLIVTATDTEFEGVTAVLRKASGQDIEARHIYYSEGVMPCKAGSWKPGDERPPMMVGVTQQTQSGAVATGNMVMVLKDALKSQQVTKKGLVAMFGMCAGDDSEVDLGDVLVPWEIAVERGRMRGDGTFDTDATYSAIPPPLRTAVQTALPKLQADAKQDKWLEYLPDELRKTPSPRYLMDATLFDLYKRSQTVGGVVDISTLYTDLIDHYKWPRKVISKSVIIEVLDNLVLAGYVDDLDKTGVDFKINDVGKEQVRILNARNDSFPRADSDTPKIKHDTVIMGDVVNTAKTKKAWDEERKRAGKRTAIGYEMEGYTFLDQLTTWCQSTRALFIKSVADFGTEEYKMKNKYYQVYATAVAAAFLFHFLEVVRPSDWQT